MFTRSLSAATCFVIASAVLAQGSTPRPAPGRAVLGKAIKVQGLVTVSDGNGVSRVLVDNAVIDRSRYVTSSSGSAILRMDKGCDIELKPNQALTIEEEKTCEGFWLAIESLGNPTGILLAGGAGGSGALVPFVVGGAIVLLIGGAGGNGTGVGSGGNPPDITPITTE